jgi:hypothetical protein
MIMLPACTCGHLAEYHYLSRVTRKHERCRAYDDGHKCPCKHYSPEVTG